MMNFDQASLQKMMNDICQIAKQAGDAIMSVYNHEDFEIQVKSDESPVTQADLAAHHVIVDALQKKYPNIPCLSEESSEISFEERKKWDECFVIDPLDGTKEFIARNDDFTVNIALIKNGKSLLGVIYAPVLETLYFAAKGVGAFKQLTEQKPLPISVRKIPKKDNQNHFTIFASRRHGLEAAKKLCEKFESYELNNRGSSLKMCLIAEGKADFYPRLALTSEWDTAAAQAIVEEAGGQLVKLDFSDMTYNQKESLLNPFFLTLGDPNFNWKKEVIISQELLGN